MKQVRGEGAEGVILYRVIREVCIDGVKFEEKSEDGTEQAMWILRKENHYERRANAEPQDLKSNGLTPYYAPNMSTLYLVGLL